MKFNTYLIPMNPPERNCQWKNIYFILKFLIYIEQNSSFPMAHLSLINKTLRNILSNN